MGANQLPESRVYVETRHLPNCRTALGQYLVSWTRWEETACGLKAVAVVSSGTRSLSPSAHHVQSGILLSGSCRAKRSITVTVVFPSPAVVFRMHSLPTARMVTRRTRASYFLHAMAAVSTVSVLRRNTNPVTLMLLAIQANYI